jgi:exosortase/archaeosortase family protein
MTAVLYFSNQTSTYLAGPYAYLIWLLVDPFTKSYLLGNVILVRGIPIQFEDICTGTLLIGMAVVFLFVRGSSRLRMLTAASALFLLNMARILLVIAALVSFGLETAAITHDAMYIAFTAISMGFSVYGTMPLLRAAEV